MKYIYQVCANDNGRMIIVGYALNKTQAKSLAKKSLKLEHVKHLSLNHFLMSRHILGEPWSNYMAWTEKLILGKKDKTIKQMEKMWQLENGKKPFKN